MSTTTEQEARPQFAASDLFRLIACIYFARHGNAEKAAEGQKDSQRKLTQKGREQAERLGYALADIPFDLALSSRHTRASETVMAACELGTSRIQSHMVEHLLELTPTDDEGDPISIMWSALSYAPLAKYHAHPLGEHMKEWGRTALTAILERADSADSRNPAKRLRILVGGHAVCQNAVAWAIGEMLLKDNISGGQAVQELAESLVLGEAEALRVSIPATKVVCSHIKP